MYSEGHISSIGNLLNTNCLARLPPSPKATAGQVVFDYAEAFASLRKPPLRFGIHKFGHPADFAFVIDAGEDAFGLG